MDEASNYFDFVQRLNRKVLTDGGPDYLIYFAIHHSALILDLDSTERIARKYAHIPILLPSFFLTRISLGHEEEVTKVYDSVDAVLASGLPDWLELEMRFLKFESEIEAYPKTLYDSSNLDKIKKLIEKSPELGFFEGILFSKLSYIAVLDGDTDEAVRFNNRAILIAEKWNDISRLSYHLRTKADYLQTSNRLEARNILLKAQKMMELLGTRAGYASILYYMSKLDATRGEYNLAIERNLEAIRIRESLNLPIGIYAIMLSTLYNAMGDPDAGLEWARMAEVDSIVHPAVKPKSILHQAWSLILMKKFTEAQVFLDSVRESILKAGIETMLAWFYFVSGVFEMAKGNFDAAAKSIEDAIELYEGKGHFENALIFLQYLAQLDLCRADISSGKVLDSSEMPWLMLLEEKAVSDDLPGILGQVHLMKVKLAIEQNDNDSLRQSISKLRSLGTEPSMNYLNVRLDRILRSV